MTKPKTAADLSKIKEDLAARLPYHLATCDWCRWKGQPVTDVEFVHTGGGARKRCTDREACRRRVTELLALKP